MRPHGCMLKFRLPWDRGSTRYVKGDIHLPVWGPQTTTETRLIVHAKDLDTSTDYDNAAYGERMFFFNTCSRVDFYQHDLPPVAGVDRCYDCAAEAHILTCYLTAIARHDARDAHLSQAIARMMHEISCNISWGRTLDSVVDKRSRMEWYEPRRFDTDACQLVCKDVEGGGCED